jgi:hypothetical protein
MRVFVDIAFVGAVSATVLYGAWRFIGPIGLVVTMPILALLGPALVELMSRIPRFMHQLAMRPWEGRYFEYQGKSMDIVIDAEAQCWISTADVRKVVATLPSDAVLERLVPTQCGEGGDPRRWRITTAGLAQVMARAGDPIVTKFCHWLEVDVARPARNRRDGRKVPG